MSYKLPIDASQIGTGLVPTNRLGSGTADNTHFLRGDQSWAVPAGGGGGNVTNTGAYGSNPGSPSAGDLYFPNNGIAVERFSGSLWVPFGPINELAYPPALASWTQININSGASAAEKGGTLRLEAPALTGNNRRAISIAAPSTPYTLTAMIYPDISGQQFNMFGFGFYDGTSTKFTAIGINGNATTEPDTEFLLRILFATGPTGGLGASTSGGTFFPLSQPIFFRVVDDGTNKQYFYSFDNIWFRQVDVTRARTYYDGATTMTPDHIIFFIDSVNSGTPVGATLASYLSTSP